MVYCGKPSRGCQMCRTRRIKCDETKPTCTQCRKSRRVCPGYKDDFDLVFRNETQATEKRAKKPSNKPKKSGSQAVVPVNRQWGSNAAHLGPKNPNSALVANSTLAQVPATLSVPIEQVASHYFFTNFVAASNNGASIGLTDFIGSLANSSLSNKHLSLAFSAASLAAFGNQPSGKFLLPKAQEQYSRAIRYVNNALRDPVEQKTDETLAAVLLLGLYETILTRPVAMAAWGSHIEGAAMLVKMRGKKQFRTRVGSSLFVAVRNHMIIQFVSTGKKLDWSMDLWTTGDGDSELRETVNRLALRSTDLRYDINGLMTLADRTPENLGNVHHAMRSCFEMEREIQVLMNKLSVSLPCTTVAWVDRISSDELLKSEVYPGKVDTYPDVWVAQVWTVLHVTRLLVSGLIVRCAAYLNTSIDYRLSPEYAVAARMGTDVVNDIIAGVPYHLGWKASKGSTKRFAVAGDDCFNFGDNQHRPKALGAYISTWPLFTAYCSDFATDPQRIWLRGRLNYITDVMGIDQAGTLALYQLRLPSMSVKRDLMTRASLSTKQTPHQSSSGSSVPPPHSSSTISPSTNLPTPQSTAYNPTSTSSPPTNIPSNYPATYPASMHPAPSMPATAPQITAYYPYGRQEYPVDEHLVAAIEGSGQKQWEQWDRERRKRELERKNEALVDEGTGGEVMLAELLKRYFSVAMLDK